MKKLKALLRNSSIHFSLELNPLQWTLASAQHSDFNSIMSYVAVGPIALDLYLDWYNEDVQITRITHYSMLDNDD
jgi:hypothetical protein